MESANPLLEQTHTLPHFSALKPEHVTPAVESILDEYQQWLDALDPQRDRTWESLAAREEVLATRLEHAWAPVSHMHGVSEDPGWRDAYATNVALLSRFFSALNQSQKRLEAYQGLKDSPEFANLDQAQKKIVDNVLRDLELSGVNLPEEQRMRFRAINEELTDLSTRFEQNIKDATDAWFMDFTSADALAGLPETALDQARDRARQADKDGYRINLEYPSYIAVMTYADDAGLRETAYQAFATRASDQGPHAGQWDNRPVIQEILRLRAEQADLLGLESYAELSLKTKMLTQTDRVEAFLTDLARRSRDKARDELEELKSFAGHELSPWDVAYYSEKLKMARYAVDDEEVRPYFSADDSMNGLFAVAQTLFGLTFRRRDDADVWHPTVALYDVLDTDGNLRASFYTDLYARKGKRGGAWMADCRSRHHIGGHSQQPVAFLNCNFPAPTESTPSLLNHDEVTTLFHEFGHCLHHMLTRIEHPAVGGISGVEWDAVELPSQFLENFAWEYEILARFAQHYRTGEPLPEELFGRMEAARQFQSGLFLVRQLEFGLTDWQMHSHFDPAQENHAFTLWREVREDVAVMEVPEYNRFLCSFAHLFAGGYAAGYYSYLWAEQLSTDAFEKFREEGTLNPQTGRLFAEQILEVGGSRPAAESFAAFRGRGPSIEPLLKHYGIEEAA